MSIVLYNRPPVHLFVLPVPPTLRKTKCLNVCVQTNIHITRNVYIHICIRMYVQRPFCHERYSSEEEEEVVEETKEKPPQTPAEGEGDPEFIKRQDQKRSDLDEQLKEYINEWRKQRAKEEDELKKLKEKQAKRKISRAEEEQKMAQRKKEEEERRVREVEEKKQREIEEKRQRLEEAEKKRQAMLQAMKDMTRRDPISLLPKRRQAWDSHPLPWSVTRLRNNWMRRRKSLCRSASNLWPLKVSAKANCVRRPKNCGNSSSNWKLKSMTWKKGRNVRITI
uniref:Troponin T, skeletal muscle n=1 Tax=Bactrocera latifrons TaxID=174628 RepID=A0A0K8WDQ2_BACLA